MEEYKPNFERLEKCNLHRIGKLFYNYNLNDHTVFLEILMKYDLQNYRNDLLAKALQYKKSNTMFAFKCKTKEKTLKLLEVLNFLEDNCSNNVTIELSNIHNKVKFESKDFCNLLTYNKETECIEDDYNLILDLYTKLLNVLNVKYSMHTGIFPKVHFEEAIKSDFNNIVKILKEQNATPKGRPNKNNGHQILAYRLQNYLQKFTPLKSESENTISNQQCLFIYDFLEYCNVWENEKSDKVKVINNYFKKGKKLEESIKKEGFDKPTFLEE